MAKATFEHARPGHEGGLRTVDGSRLTVIDHRGLLVLRDDARCQGATVVLRMVNPTAAWLVERFDLDDVRLEAA